MSEIIRHTGIVTEILDSVIHVTIISESACSSCHAKGACSASDMEEKVIRINVENNNYTVGQKVTVTMKENMGFLAVMLAYLVPFFVLLVSLIIFVNIFEETVAAFLSLVFVGMYFVLLYYKRKKISKVIAFEIEK